MSGPLADERVTDLVAHAVVLRVRAEELLHLTQRNDDVALGDLTPLALRLAERAAEVLHIAEQLAGITATSIWW